nr:MAG TPA: hypothetical protein [Caudoviricetes sp.]
MKIKKSLAGAICVSHLVINLGWWGIAAASFLRHWRRKLWFLASLPHSGCPQFYDSSFAGAPQVYAG